MSNTFHRHSTMKFVLGITPLISLPVPLSFLTERTSMTANRAGHEVDSAAPALDSISTVPQT